MNIHGQKIFIGEIPVQKLAEQYDTPIFVYDEQKIRNNFRRANEAFRRRYENFRMFYAIKANCNLAIAHILRQEGAGIDAASINEILLAKELGLQGEDVIFSGNYLSDDDLRQGLASRVIFNLDDISLLPRLLQFGKPKILSFRINPGIGHSNVGSYVVNAGPEAKFGIHPDKVFEAYQQAKAAGIKRFGVHMMTGSCVTEPEYFGNVTERLMDIVGRVGRQLAIDFEFIDIGGGLGIPYRPSEKPLDIEKTAEIITKAFTSKVQEYNLRAPRLIMEPARYFIGDAGYLIGRIHVKKESYKTIYGSDIGMNLVPRIILYGAYHGILVDGKVNMPTRKINLCGQICEQTDLWSKDRDLPELEVGDLIVIENCGAYCFGMSYQYNGRLLPAEILVNGLQSCLIRKAEIVNDLIYNIVVPEYLKNKSTM